MMGMTRPKALEDIEQIAGLGEEVPILGKQLAAILPGSDGVFMEPTPHCGNADGGY